tara:strand:- start:1484 stop:2215 length:732 start_codon:yes stop_codon:yes gene_type:complete
LQAIILAGGKGTRLKPFTLVYPKPLLPVGGKPIIDTIVRQLIYYGFKEIIVSAGYMGDMIKLYFDSISEFHHQVNINVVLEDQELGTAGPISIIDGLQENFLVINGDILTSMNFSNLMEFHNQKKSLMTLAVGKKKINLSLGIVELNEDDEITEFSEKPEFEFNDNMGIYVYNKKILDFMKERNRIDVDSLVKILLEKNKEVYGYFSDASYYWIDIGQHADYEIANEKFEIHKKEFLPNKSPY